MSGIFSLGRPTDDDLIARCRDAERAPFSYAPQGLTRTPPASGYNVDRHETTLGHGEACFDRAASALRVWTPLRLPWLQIASPPGEVERDAVLAIAAQVLGLWVVNLCRVVEITDEPDRFGVAYGTLHDHAEVGEERFEVERLRHDDSVRFRIVAVSRPRHVLVRLGYPLSRRLQARFGREAMEAMRAASAATVES